MQKIKMTKTQRAMLIVKHAREHITRDYMSHANGTLFKDAIEACEILKTVGAKLASQNRANQKRTAVHRAMLDMGLRAYRGSVSGRMYYE